MRAMKRQCPDCRRALTRSEWLALWWAAAGLGDGLARPCGVCGAVLRLSAGALLTIAAAATEAATAAALYVRPSALLQCMALTVGLIIFVGISATAVESIAVRAVNARR